MKIQKYVINNKSSRNCAKKYSILPQYCCKEKRKLQSYVFSKRTTDSLAVKKCAVPKSQGEKKVKSKVVAKKWL